MTELRALGTDTILDVRGLCKRYRVRENGRNRTRTVVDEVSFSIERGRTLGIVGESGSGKSTTARMVTRLVQADAGSVRFDGVDVLALRGRALREWRRRVQIVFQDPYSALNPRATIGHSIGFALLAQGVPRAERRTRAIEALERVGLRAALADAFPRQLSGGQLQRVSIARALAVGPELLVLDEPVAALDKSVQAHVVNLLSDLQRDLGLSYAFISHDLDVVRYLSDNIVVMNKGEIVDRGPAKRLFADSQHPYTRSLVDALDGEPEPPRAERSAS